jgi:putative ATPase
MRGSDVDAALHYLARMLEAGEDPRFVARRIVIAASEDVGMADPTALQTAVAAAQAVQLIGMPEARIVLGHAVVHLATAPKSNAAYQAINAATRDIRAGLGGPVPPHLRDAHYAGAQRLGHGRGYRYSHDDPAASSPSSTRRTRSPGATTTSRRTAARSAGWPNASSGYVTCCE